MSTSKDTTKPRAGRKIADADPKARTGAEAVLAGDALKALTDLIEEERATFAAFGEICNLTDSIWREEHGLPREPSEADQLTYENANEAHDKACRVLLDYQPATLAELVALAEAFTRIDVCDLEDGMEALARMIRTMAGTPGAPAPTTPETPNNISDDAASAVIAAVEDAILTTPCASLADTVPKLRLIARGMEVGETVHDAAAMADVIAFLSDEVSANPTARQATLPALLAVREEFNARWNAAGDMSQEEDNGARAQLKSYDEHIVRAPIASAPDARAKLQLILSHQSEGVEESDMLSDVLTQVETWLSAIDSPPPPAGGSDVIKLALQTAAVVDTAMTDAKGEPALVSSEAAEAILELETQLMAAPVATMADLFARAYGIQKIARTYGALRHMPESVPETLLADALRVLGRWDVDANVDQFALMASAANSGNAISGAAA